MEAFSGDKLTQAQNELYGWIKDYMKEFNGFTIDSNLMKKANEDVIVLHCLPAYRSKEISDEVIECKQSRIFEQAENRMHAQQALLSCLLH